MGLGRGRGVGPTGPSPKNDSSGPTQPGQKAGPRSTGQARGGRKPEVQPGEMLTSSMTSANACKFFLPLARAMHAPTVKNFEFAFADVIDDVSPLPAQR